MRTINLKLTGLNSKVMPQIFVDGQMLKYKKNNFGSYEVVYTTEKEKVDVEIKRNLELKSKLWWLYSILSFIISVFGIFEPPYDKKNIVMDCKFSFELNEINDIKLIFNSLALQGRAVEVETQTSYTEITNDYHVDKKAKRRWITLLIIKIIFWVVLAILIAYLGIKNI